MGIKVYKPTTPGRRKSSVDDFSDVTKKNPEKSLLKIIKDKQDVIIAEKLLLDTEVVVLKNIIV